MPVYSSEAALNYWSFSFSLKFYCLDPVMLLTINLFDFIEEIFLILAGSQMFAVNELKSVSGPDETLNFCGLTC